MRRLPESLINDIRSKTDVVDVVSRYISLSKKGKNYVGVCPFHDDHDPSMSVSPDRQIYKCFVCGAGGNVFTFIQDYEKVNFIDAVLKTATYANIDVSEYESIETKPVDEEKEKLLEAMDEAQKFTSFQLFTKEGQRGLSAIRERGYDDALIKEFGIGVVYDNFQLTKFLKAKGFDDETLIACDLARLNDRGVMDVFYDRIMFPIHNRYGQVIAFSARALDNNNSVKYINSSETKLYVKGKTVYNFHRAKDVARKQGFIILSEGVTDTIAFTKIGFPNVASLLGVACTPDQIRLIKECSHNIVLAFDGDRAGLEATYQIGTKLRNEQCNITVWYNDSGLDPDEAVRKNGKDAVKRGIDDRIHWLDFLMSYAIGQYGLDSFEKRKHVVEFMLKHLGQEDELEQSYYLKKLADKTGFEYSVLSQQLVHKTDQPEIVQRTIVENMNQFNISIPERSILKYMMLSKEAAYIYRDQLGFLISDLATDFALILLDQYRNQQEIAIADILSLDVNDKLKKFAIELEEDELIDRYNKEGLYQNIELVKKRLVTMNVNAYRNQIREQVTIDDQIELLEQAIKTMRTNKKENMNGEKD